MVLPDLWGPRARACGRRHSQSSRMTLASMMTRAPRLMPAPPARSAAAPGRQAPSWPQRHTVTFRGCSRCWGGCPESWSSRLRRCSPSGTRSLGRRRAWLTAEGACGQAGAGDGCTPPCLCTEQQPTGWRSWHARPRFPQLSSASDNQSPPGLRVHQREPPPGSEPQGCVWGGSPLTWLRLQFRASSGTLGLSWKWKGAPWGGRSSSVAPKRRPEPRSGVLHRLPHGGDSSGAWSLTSRISMDRVPVAVLGGEAVGGRGLVGPWPLWSPHQPCKSAEWSAWLSALGQQQGPQLGLGSPGTRLGSPLTVILGQDDGPVPAILEEGG